MVFLVFNVSPVVVRAELIPATTRSDSSLLLHALFLFFFQPLLLVLALGLIVLAESK